MEVADELGAAAPVTSPGWAPQVEVREVPEDHECYKHAPRPPAGPKQYAVYATARRPPTHPAFEQPALVAPPSSRSCDGVAARENHLRLGHRSRTFLVDSDFPVFS